METRKLQQVGGGTYTVSIPKEWADSHGLEAGMDVRLFTHADGSIVVRDVDTDGGDLASATVRVAGADAALVGRAIRSAHAAGFETVTLVPAGDRETFTEDQRRTARTVVRRLVGTDLVVERADEITAQHLLDAANVSVRQSVVQLQFTALAVHDAAVDAVLTGDPEAAERLDERRQEATRLARMVERHCARALVSLGEVDDLGLSRPELYDYDATATALDRVADEAVRLAAVPADHDGAAGNGALPETVRPDVRAAADDVRRAIEDATTAVLDGPGTAATAHAALEAVDDATVTAEAVERAAFDGEAGTSEVDPAATVATARALDALARTADRAGDVAAVALRASARAENTGDRSGEPAVASRE